MSVKLPEKAQEDPKEEVKEEDADNLPPADDTSPEPAAEKTPAAPDKTRDLELELAEAKGRLSVLESKKTESSTPQISSEEDQYYKAKAIVMGDMSSLDDESFGKKYNMDKANVRLHYVEYERNMDRQKNQEQIARMQAENDVLSKYGKNFAKYRSDVTQAIDEASPEVRRDPTRLAKFMERTYLAFSRDDKDDTSEQKSTKQKEKGESMRRIVNDFDAPSASSDKNKGRKEENDDLEGEDLEVGRHFGIRTKSEREKYAGKYLEMNMGGGVIFKDPKIGFEKVVKK